ncbi:hypothetical protein [Bacillus sp. FJAT-45037]|uniref:hypothetical protein n=1 Tax=Bacillus sp. FJAT-45037 TaxID=2011007 RepID=UPI000C24EF2D|nr:hypothetical protein [Bacillus sp. FJAT-45037]
MKPHEQMEFELMMQQLEKVVPGMLGAYPTIAKLTRSYYLELKKQGFNEKEALHIVSTQGFIAGTQGGGSE